MHNLRLITTPDSQAAASCSIIQAKFLSKFATPLCSDVGVGIATAWITLKYQEVPGNSSPGQLFEAK